MTYSISFPSGVDLSDIQPSFKLLQDGSLKDYSEEAQEAISAFLCNIERFLFTCKGAPFFSLEKTSDALILRIDPQFPLQAVSDS